MREMHLFAGAGGGILGGLLLGHTPVCAVEIDPYCRKVLAQRIADGFLPEMHIHDDIKTFDATGWRNYVDVIAAGFPCTDISLAGKGEGIHGEKSSLFFEAVRVIREVEPRFVFLENVPALTSRGLDRVLGEMADLGFDAAWTVLSAADCGANHLRKRIWILCEREVGHSQQPGLEGYCGSEDHIDQQGRDCTESVGPTAQTGLCKRERERERERERRIQDWWSAEPSVGRLDHGVADRVGRLKALGNGQVPVVAATAWKILEQSLRNTVTK
jgi:DNA (cytosine-5)-methyltransferase 1